MRWRVPLLDDELPHQIRLTTDSWKLYVSCTCLKHGTSWVSISSYTVGVVDPRVIWQRWHSDRGIDIAPSRALEVSARG